MWMAPPYASVTEVYSDSVSRRQEPSADLVLAERLFEAISLARRQARRVANAPEQARRLAGSQVELIRLVRRRPGTSVAEAASELALAPNTVSTLVRQLSDAGLLRREPDVADRRVVRLSLTASAQQRVQRWRDRRAAAAAVAIAELEPTERTALEAALPVMTKLAEIMGRQQEMEPG